MKRLELEHVIRAAGMIANDDELIVVGSQAILGQFPEAPAELLVSIEADIYPKNNVDLADLIDGSIGEGSPFQQTFGYYAHGVEPSTAILPQGWQERLVPIQNENTRRVTGWCLEVHDLALSKYVAGPDKDLVFTAGLARNHLVEKEILLARLEMMEIDKGVSDLVSGRICADFGKL